MRFDWEKFWNVGEHLMNYREEEEYQRSAVGRYYYACYLKARELYNKKNNFWIGKSIGHQKLIDEFKGSNNETERKIGQYLAELKKFRTNADYYVDFNVDLNQANEISKDLLLCLKNLKKK